MIFLKHYEKMLFKSIAIILLVAFTFASCKKDSGITQNGNPAIEGLYVGKYGFGNAAPDTDYKLRFKSGGILEEIGFNSGTVTGSGSWQLNGNTVSGTYTMLFSPFSKYSVSGTINASTNKLSGTWGYDNSSTDGGKLEMTKQ